MPWECPECGRLFSRNRQAHSCESYDLKPLFMKSKEGVRELYDILMKKVGEFGAVDPRVGPYNVSVRNLSTFLNIMPERDHLTISFVRDEPLDEFPIYQTYQRSAKKWSNHLKIESPDEIDEQLINWIKDAYDLAGS